MEDNMIQLGYGTKQWNRFSVKKITKGDFKLLISCTRYPLGKIN